MPLRWPIDADLAVFLCTVGKVVFAGLPRLRRKAKQIPVRYEIAEVHPAALTEAQASFFAPYDEKLAAMNYRPVCTYRIANYGSNLLRNYVSPLETSRCVVMINETPVVRNGKPSVANSCTLSFHTRFNDATILSTRNMRIKSVLDKPPYQVVQECPGITEPAAMKRKHDSRAASLACPVSPPCDTATTFKDLQAEHERFGAHQVSRGSLRLNPDGNSYTITDKVRWRGIRNHLNPLANRFPFRHFIPAALVAVALPSFAVLKLAPAAADAARNVGFSPFAAAEAVTLASYLIAGALIGYVLERQTFVWVFLLTYLSVRILAGNHLGPVPYSAFAGSVAYSVAQAKKRRRAVLLPQRV